ncbi:HGL208Cp [Eremothecium sinecaudum]|uniref:HGL208Cp n=1 Tax=Eremothecium sinecaudum TaxID=45286 RepID=A0A0X8HV72_9SACH|nr:HGL208Cp [Eremothecium sinecaudum]AMD22132.1 HGL208Cp [Eremothecium sinecaudum]
MSVHYDVTDYVEAPTGRGNLQFSDEKQQARFELGVAMMVYKWDALDIAVENQWGGPESAEKRDWISGIVVELFKKEKIVDVTLVEETLLYAMSDEFETNVEDDSALPIAAGIVSLYRQCEANEYSEIEKLYGEWQKRSERRASHKAVHVVEDPSNPDVSESEDGSDEEEDEDAMDIEEEDDAGKADQRDGPIVDENGFQLVQSKGSRRR